MFCPSCGQQTFIASSEKSFQCSECAFTFFKNTASAVLAIIRCQDEILVAVRAREPGKGMWDFPGGFVDYDESLEQALFRELEEELAFKAENARYFGSCPNTYRYKDVVYKTCDAFFAIELKQKPNMQANDDVADVKWVKTSEIQTDKFAFDSARKALALYLAD